MVQGNVQHDDVDSGYPVKIGGKSETTAPSAVADNDRVNAWFDQYGRLVIALKNTAGTELAAIDDSAFTPGTGGVVPVGFLADETAPDSVDEGDIGAARMTLSRILWAALRAKGSTSADTELLSDNSGALRASLYGKSSAAGDTPMLVNSAGAVMACIAGATVAVDAANDVVTFRGQANDNYRLAVGSSAFNGATWDRLRTIAATGAGLGVQQVGTPGEAVTLAASTARTTGANGTTVSGVGWRKRWLVLLDVTVAATNAGDTLDVYIDGSIDNSTFLNIAHFTQVLGNGGAKKYFAVLDGNTPAATDTAVTADAAAGAVRAAMAGLPYMRARWAVVDGGGAVQSFTFSVTAWAI